MASAKKSHRGLKICCGVTALFLFILVIVSIVLFLTVFKPKQPQTVSQSVTFKQIYLIPFPIFKLKVILGLDLTIDNRNYGSFKYKNTTAYAYYRGAMVAEAPIVQDTVPARGKHNISTSVEIIGEKLVLNPDFMRDFYAGSLNFSTPTTLNGKVGVLKILKMSATAYSSCDISLFVKSRNVDSICYSKLKF